MYYNNRRLALSIFWAVLGVVLIVLSVTEVLDSSLYAAVGILQCIRNVRYRKDTEYREKIDIELKDERNRYLRMKSWAWAGYIVVLAEGVGVVVAMVLGKETVQLILSCSVCLLLCAYWISYLVLNRKY